jgi:hypothetical protein
MTTDDSPSNHRNAFGQAVRPKRLSRPARELICNAIESAINAGKSEVRVYWTHGGREVFVAALQIGERTKLSAREAYGRTI